MVLKKFPWQLNQEHDYAHAKKSLVRIPGLRSYQPGVAKVGMDIIIQRFCVKTRRWFQTTGKIDHIDENCVLRHTATTDDGDSGAAILNEGGQVVGIHLNGAPKGDERNSGFAFTQPFINRLFPKGSPASSNGS